MREETKKKIRVRIDRIKAELPAFVTGSVIGMAVFGYFNSISNTNKIVKVQKEMKWVEKRIDDHSQLINQHADAGNRLVEICKDRDKRIEELEERQALLMEQALRRTEGKG